MKDEDGGHPCLASSIKGKGFSVLPLVVVLTVGFFWALFITLRKCFSSPQWLMVLF